MTTVAVLGAGSWGTTLADLLARKGLTVRLWAHEAEVASAINEQRENTVFLPDAPLAESLRAFTDPSEAVDQASVIVSAVPSHAVVAVLARIRSAAASDAVLVSVTKGIDAERLALMSQLIEELLPAAPLAVLSGPSFAQEVYAGQPTAVVAASTDARTATAVQELFATPRFRVYSNADVVGVELGGALKNVIAIAAGMLEGLGLGHNPRAALVTRGLAEITRLGRAMGADPITFAGLAGMGDLVLTTTGALSRNRGLGIALAEGRTLTDYRATHRGVAEGANTSKAAVRLAARMGVEMPIATNVYEILFEGKSPRDSVDELMGRGLKAEQWQ